MIRAAIGRGLTTLTLDRTVTILLFIAIAFAACFTPAQNDTWWHLRAGAETWRLGGVHLVDTFSHTAYGTYWPNQEWLGEVLMYGAYRGGGLPAMTACAALLITASWAIVWRLTPGVVTRRAALCAVAIMCCAREWSLRPKLFTLFFVAVTMFLIVRRRYVWLPLLFAIWANVHGGVILGVVILFVAAAANAACERRVWNSLTIAAIGAAVLTNATPLGWSLWPEVIASLGRIRQYGIQEWQPAGLLDAGFLPFWVISAALVALAIAARAWRVDRQMTVVLWPALALLPLAVRAGRNAPPALMLAVPALALLIERRFPPRVRTDARRWPLLKVVAVFASAAGAFAIVLHAWRVSDPHLAWAPLPAAAADAVSTCPERLYNRYDEGGFLIWFAPAQKVFIDGRQDPYPPSLLVAQKEVERSGEYEDLFRRYSIHCAFLPSGTVVGNRLAADGWATRYADAQWTVLAAPSPLTPDPTGARAGANARSGAR